MTVTRGFRGSCVQKHSLQRSSDLGNSGAKRADKMPSEFRAHSTETNHSPWVKGWGLQGFGEEAYGASWVALLGKNCLQEM